MDPLHITYFLVYRETVPFSSTSNTVIDTRTHTRDLGTGSTVSAQTMGEVAAKMRAARDLHMTAELPRQTAPIHHFQTHAAPARAAPYFLYLAEPAPRRQRRLYSRKDAKARTDVCKL